MIPQASRVANPEIPGTWYGMARRCGLLGNPGDGSRGAGGGGTLSLSGDLICTMGKPPSQGTDASGRATAIPLFDAHPPVYFPTVRSGLSGAEGDLASKAPRGAVVVAWFTG